MKKFRKIGVLTSGGDAPGMNAAVRAVVRTAINNGVEVVGIYRGYSGLICGDIKPLELRDVSNIINKGGTILYSDRCPEFKTPAGMAKALKTCHENAIDGIVAIGGDGTFRGATDLTAHGIPCVGIPATIDNDISSTDASIGYDTAMNTVIELADKLRDTCESHARCNVIEVMGRGAGDIALSAGIASGATAVVIPENRISAEEVCDKISASRKLGKRNFIVMVSEGCGSDCGPELASTIQEKTGVDTKFARLAHVVRGGNPNLQDRVLASKMGVFAVNELLQGNSNIVICIRNGDICYRDINYALNLDHMYKGKTEKLKLDSFDDATIAKMKEEVEERRVEMQRLFDVATTISL